MHVPAARRYLPGTMVLETSWGTPNGWVIIRDVLLIGPWHHERERSRVHRRVPTDYDAEHILLRSVRCVNGEVQLSLECEPVFDYGLTPGQWTAHRAEPPFPAGLGWPETLAQGLLSGGKAYTCHVDDFVDSAGVAPDLSGSSDEPPI